MFMPAVYKIELRCTNKHCAYEGALQSEDIHYGNFTKSIHMLAVASKAANKGQNIWRESLT
jgi:hypothetical protein